jgi:uncharacterized protein YdhG (YjbR/CyaY superfamily)
MAVPATVEAYLAALPAQQRAVLEDLRATIRAAAPDATELIAYGMPAFKSGGRLLVSYAAFKRHYSLFPASGAVLEALGDEIGPFYTAKATIQFTVERPLSADLVTRFVRVRLEEIAAPGR